MYIGCMYAWGTRMVGWCVRGSQSWPDGPWHRPRAKMTGRGQRAGRACPMPGHRGRARLYQWLVAHSYTANYQGYTFVSFCQI